MMSEHVCSLVAIVVLGAFLRSAHCESIGTHAAECCNRRRAVARPMAGYPHYLEIVSRSGREKPAEDIQISRHMSRHSCCIEPSRALAIQEVAVQSHLAAVRRTSTRSMHGRGLCICLRLPETSNAPSERLSLQRCPRRSQSCAIPSDSDSASPPAANSASARARAGRWRRGGSLNLSAAGSLEA